MKIGIQEAVHKLYKQDGKCFYCDRLVKNLSVTVDHAKALCRGGKNESGNRVMACRECNCRKSFLNASEYRIGLLPIEKEDKQYAQPRATRKWPYFVEEYAIRLSHN